MIAVAAICPSPPLLARALTGGAEVLPELRAACAVAVARLLAAGPDLVAVAGPAEATETWDPAGELSLARYAPALRAGGRLTDGYPTTFRAAAPSLPLALGLGAMLLDEAGYLGPRLLQAVAVSESRDGCLALGRDVAASAPRVALLVMGDGTARRSAAAPGYLDERAEPFDEAVERAVRDGDLPALAALDPALAADLMAEGRAAWQVLAGALPTDAPAQPRPRTEILYSGAPLGVAYLVATLIPA